MFSIIKTLFLGYVAMALIMFFLWRRQRKTLVANSVDVAWSASFSLYALLGLLLIEQNFEVYKSLVVAFVVFWSLRLAGYLKRDRCFEGAPEDKRYSRLRKKWTQKDFFFFYQGQAFFSLPLALNICLAMAAPYTHFESRHFWGLGIFLLAILGESLADKQLAAHRKDPSQKTKTCRRGLWKYSRHPNYFFEWLHWWAYVILASKTGAFWITLSGPVVMLYLFFRVTGIPPTEAAALKSRSDYKDYQEKTSAFFPWFPKN